MARLIKFDVKEMPKLHVIGKELRYSEDAHMKGDNRIPAFWDTCFADGTFAALEQQAEYIFDDAYIGIMLDWDKGDGNFSYVCGMLFKEGAAVPDGFVKKELAATKAAVGWIQGKDTADVCMAAHKLTEKAIRENGYSHEGMKWCMELYNCPRFTTPDENGEIVLDYYIPVR